MTEEKFSLELAKPDDLALEASASQRVVEWAKTLGKISTAQEAERAGDIVRKLRDTRNKFDEQRKQVTQPLNEAIRRVNSWFKPIIEPLADAEDILRSGIALYKAEADAHRKDALVEASDGIPDALARTAPTEMPSGVSVRHEASFEITDEDAVPREFCSPDRVKIKAALARGSVIPGVTPTIKNVVVVK